MRFLWTAVAVRRPYLKDGARRSSSSGGVGKERTPPHTVILAENIPESGLERRSNDVDVVPKGILQELLDF